MGAAQREHGHHQRRVAAQLAVRSGAGATAVVHALRHLLLLGGGQWCGQSGKIQNRMNITISDVQMIK